MLVSGRVLIVNGTPAFPEVFSKYTQDRKLPKATHILSVAGKISQDSEPFQSRNGKCVFPGFPEFLRVDM